MRLSPYIPSTWHDLRLALSNRKNKADFCACILYMMTPTHFAEFVQKDSPEDASEDASEYASEYTSEWQRTAACHRRIRHAAKHTSKAQLSPELPNNPKLLSPSYPRPDQLMRSILALLLCFLPLQDHRAHALTSGRPTTRSGVVDSSCAPASPRCCARYHSWTTEQTVGARS